VFIGVSAHTCMSICVCIMFLKKKLKDPPKAFEKGGGGGESQISVVDLLQLIPRDSSQQLVSSGSWELGNNFNIAHISG
jgi:hypothetical protein